jgi:hypothetical protein
MFTIHKTQQKKIEKIMQWPSIKSPPLWYGGGFSLQNKCKKTHFLNGILSNILKFKIFLYLVDVYQYHTP